jgi:hypothetical protein
MAGSASQHAVAARRSSGRLLRDLLSSPTIRLRAARRRSRSSIAERLLKVAKDLWRVSCAPSGYLALLVVFLPIGTGAASNLFAAVAPQWGRDARGDRSRGSGDQIQLVRIVIEYADCLHDGDGRMGEFAVGRDWLSVHRGGHERCESVRIRCGQLAVREARGAAGARLMP